MVSRKEGPDQARSWAIAFAAFVIYALLSGISIKSSGSKQGPLVGILGERYGSRNVTIIGCIFASLGIILCTFATNVLWITILWGGVHGLGVALGSTLSQVIVPQYFLKYRSTASGISLSGPCLGSFVLPILLEYMLANLGLAGTFLLTGGIMMHVLPVSIMMVEPPWTRKSILQRQDNFKTTSKLNCYSIASDQDKCKTNVEDLKDFKGDNLNLVASQRNLNKDTGILLSVNDASKGIDNPTFATSQSNLDEIKSYRVVEVPISQDRLRTISFAERSLKCQQVSDGDQETSILKGMMKVLRNPMFHLISLSFASFAMVVDPALTVIVDYLMEKGHKEEVAKYFIVMMSISDLIGRMGFGWVTDYNYLSPPKFMMILHVGLGLCFLLMPLFNGFDSLLTVVVIYGLFSGAILVMFPILVGKYLHSVQSLAIGFSAFLSGVLSFTVPPLIGYFRDEVGSYDGMFCLTGGLSVVMGVSWLFEPILVKVGAKLRQEQSGSVIASS